MSLKNDLKNLNETSDLEKNLQDSLESLAELTAIGIDPKNIFEIKYEQTILGFITSVDIKANFSHNENEAKRYFIRNSEQNLWQNLYETDFIQKRKTQLVVEVIEASDDLDFFLLQNGKKIGPYTKMQLKEMCKNKEILLTDMVSFNGGHLWVKLFQIEGFNRRESKLNQNLPNSPELSLIEKPVDSAHTLEAVNDAITSLAFLGHLKKGNDKDQKYQEELHSKAEATTIYKWMLVLSIVGIFYFIYNIKNQLTTPLDNLETNSVGEKNSKISEPNEGPIKFKNTQPEIHNSIQDNGRGFNPKENLPIERKLAPIKPKIKKSFMETQTFKDATTPPLDPAQRLNEDSNYYFDNASPLEVDPVRSQISKENTENPNPNLPTGEFQNDGNEVRDVPLTPPEPVGPNDSENVY